MYFYLYDSYLQDKKYSKTLDRIEARLTDLGINGQIAKLSLLKNAEELIRDALHRGIKTIVLVGDDKTISLGLRAMVNQDVAVGFIPVAGESQRISRLFGIPEESEAACELLSKRIKVKIDVGKVDNNYFLGSLKILSPDVILESDSAFRLIPEKENEISICNLNLVNIKGLGSNFFNPSDGRLEIVIQPTAKNSFFKKILSNKPEESCDFTIMPISKIRLLSAQKENGVKVLLDYNKVLKTPLEVSVAEKALEVIKGKS